MNRGIRFWNVYHWNYITEAPSSSHLNSTWLSFQTWLHSPKLLYYYSLSKPLLIYTHELDSLKTPLGPEHYACAFYSLPFPLQSENQCANWVKWEHEKTYTSLLQPERLLLSRELHTHSWKHIFMYSFSVLPTQSTLKGLSEMPLCLQKIKVTPLITHFFSGKGHPAQATYSHNYWHCVETSFPAANVSAWLFPNCWYCQCLLNSFPEAWHQKNKMSILLSIHIQKLFLLYPKIAARKEKSQADLSSITLNWILPAYVTHIYTKHTQCIFSPISLCRCGPLTCVSLPNDKDV